MHKRRVAANCCMYGLWHKLTSTAQPVAACRIVVQSCILQLPLCPALLFSTQAVHCRHIKLLLVYGLWLLCGTAQSAVPCSRSTHLVLSQCHERPHHHSEAVALCQGGQLEGHRLPST